MVDLDPDVEREQRCQQVRPGDLQLLSEFGDGHWVEYDPVFSDKMRKVGGDLAADGDGFLKAMGTTRELLLSISVAECPR